MGNLMNPIDSRFSSSNPFRFRTIENDFLGNQHLAQTAPWVGTAVAGGTAGTASSLINADHVGVIDLLSSTSANSGYNYVTGTVSLLVSGGESFTSVFTVHTLSTEVTVYSGLINSITAAESTNGVYLKIVNGIVTGTTADNGTRSSTGTTYTLSAGTWYRAHIDVNKDATLVTFRLYNSGTGALLWSDTLATNIPTASTRTCSPGHAAYDVNTGLSAKSLTRIDFIGLSISRALVR